MGFQGLAMHHAGSIFFVAVLVACFIHTKAENNLQNVGELADKRAWNNFQGSYGKRAWNHFNAGYGKRAWNHFNAGYGKRAWNNQFTGFGRRSFDDNDDVLEDDYSDDLNEMDHLEKKAWNSGFAGGIGKRAWNSGFAGAIGKRAWNSGFAGGIGKRAWNSGFAGGIGKRAWNSGFQGGLGKRSNLEFDDEDLDQYTPTGEVIKRNWSSLGIRGSWGKRSSPQYMFMTHDDYNKILRDNFDKRTRGWIALRGMWGKRSSPPLEVEKKTPIPKVTEEEAEEIMHGKHLEQI